MTDSIKNKIGKLEVGYIFTADEFEETAKSPTTVSRILNGFVGEGVFTSRKSENSANSSPTITKW